MDRRESIVPARERLLKLMSRYRVEWLAGGLTAKEFERRVRQFLGVRDHAIEGFADPERQRDLSIRFPWGHDHDFGSFALDGRMGDRHLWLLETFIEKFGTGSSRTGLPFRKCWRTWDTATSEPAAWTPGGRSRSPIAAGMWTCSFR